MDRRLIQNISCMDRISKMDKLAKYDRIITGFFQIAYPANL
jgi:hypothetical protein